MSSEEMADCGDDSRLIRLELENRINELIKDSKLGQYNEWAVITMILSDKGPDYKEIVRRSIKDGVLEFRLKIDYNEFIAANYEQKKKLVLNLLLESLDLMNKWKDIPVEDSDNIKKIIISEYAKYFTEKV